MIKAVLAILALLFTASGSAASGINFYPIPTPLSFPIAAASAASGDIWFLESEANKLGVFRVKSETFTEYRIPTVKSVPVDLAVDSKGMVWFIEQDANQIGKFDPAKGAFEEFEIPTPRSQPYKIAIDPKGRVWFTEFSSSKIGVFDPATRKFKEYGTPSRASQPVGISASDDGTVWFIETGVNKLASLDPSSGKMKEFLIPIPFAVPGELVSDGKALWFSARKDKKLVRFAPGKGFKEFQLPGRRVPEGLLAEGGQIWYCDQFEGKVGRMDSKEGTFVEIDLPPSTRPFAIAITKGKVWFTEISRHKLGVIELASVEKKKPGSEVILDRESREAIGAR